MKDQHFGTWTSPLSAEQVALGGNQFQDLVVDNDDIYWTEMRPSEGGRTALLKWNAQGEPIECLPPEYNVRTRVHEYGKGAFTVAQGVIYFIHNNDQKLYRCLPNSLPQALTTGKIRLADLQMTSKGLIAIAESHEDPSHEPQNFLARVDMNTGEITALTEGFDFYASPAISKDERKIAWIAWHHPNMPWDNTTLWMADLSDDGLQNITQIDPDFSAQSFFQPRWNSQNQLWVVSDKSNWWNLYRVENQALVPVITFDGEMGQPMWVFGLSTWDFYEKGVAFIHTGSSGTKHLSYFCEGNTRTFDLPFTAFSHLRVIKDDIICFAGAPTIFTTLIRLNKERQYRVLRQISNIQIDPEDISSPSHFSFPSRHGRQAYAYFYAPPNKLPPLLVICHGGPTAQANNTLDFDIQYWTTRGFAVLDVDYIGSTGYGRTYRQGLYGHWGEYDVEDCLAAIQYVIDKKWVDPQKIAMAGSSASGLTILLALAQSDLVKAACIRYGVTDLISLIEDTHKFELRYVDQLVGCYPAEKEKYDARSPMNQVDKMGCPILFFHGDEDKVVPLSQTERMVERLRDRGIMCECIVFEGEQHGFRQAKNRASVLAQQHTFFIKALDLDHERR